MKFFGQFSLQFLLLLSLVNAPYGRANAECNNEIHNITPLPEILKTSKQELGLDTHRSLNHEEITFLRGREGYGPEITDIQVTGLYRSKVIFGRLAIQKKLVRYYEKKISATFNFPDLKAQAETKMRAIYGEPVSLPNPEIPSRDRVIDLVIDEQTHLDLPKGRKQFNADEIVDIYLVEMLQEKLSVLQGIGSLANRTYGSSRDFVTKQWTTTTFKDHLQKQIDTQNIPELKKLLLARKTDAQNWNDEQTLAAANQYQTDLANGEQNYKTEGKKIVALQNEILLARGWKFDFVTLSENAPNEAEIKKGLEAFWPRNSTPGCCLSGCKSGCPYSLGYTPKQKMNWALLSSLRQWSSVPAPPSLRFYQAVKDLKNYVSASSMAVPATTYLGVWMYLE